MDIFRIFDALNDPRNMECAIKAAKAAGKKAHGVICYTTSPVHNTKSFVNMGVELEKMGADAIVLKDMAGLIPPVAKKSSADSKKKSKSQSGSTPTKPPDSAQPATSPPSTPE